MPTTTTHRSHPLRRLILAWPSQVDLPSDQSTMDEVDWIDYIEANLNVIQLSSPVDRHLLEDTRRALLTLRRHLYRKIGATVPRWPRQSERNWGQQNP